MHDLKEKFIRILIIELEDLDEDVKMLIKESEVQHNNEEISEFLFLENLAVLQNELFGVESFYNEIKALDIQAYNDVDELITDVIKKLEKRVHENGLVHSVIPLVERKISKVKRYISEQTV